MAQSDDQDNITRFGFKQGYIPFVARGRMRMSPMQADLHRAGIANVTLYEHFAQTEKPTGKDRFGYSIRSQKRDTPWSLATKSFRLDKPAGGLFEGYEDDENGQAQPRTGKTNQEINDLRKSSNLERLRSSGAAVAADIVKGNDLSGYYVMPDSQRFKGIEDQFMPENWTKQHGIYHIGMERLEDGKLRITTTPQGALGEAVGGRSVSRVLDTSGAADYLSRLIKTDLPNAREAKKYIRAQDLIMVHQRVRLALTGRTGDEYGQIGEKTLFDPDGFRQILEAGRVPFSGIKHEGVNAILGRKASKLYRQIMSGFTDPMGTRLGLGIVSVFDQSFNSSFNRVWNDRRPIEPRLQGDPKQIANAIRNEFMRDRIAAYSEANPEIDLTKATSDVRKMYIGSKAERRQELDSHIESLLSERLAPVVAKDQEAMEEYKAKLAAYESQRAGAYSTARIAAWRGFINPVFDSMQRTIRGQGMPAGAEVFTQKAIQGHGLGLLSRVFTSYGISPVQDPDNPQSSESLKAKLDSLNRSVMGKDEIDHEFYVRNRLAYLDDVESNEKKITLGGGRLRRNRLGSYLHLKQSIESTLERQGAAKKFRVEYRFQEKNPITGSGYGVFVNIIHNDSNLIKRGTASGGSQFFVPIEDTDGTFSVGGKRYVGRFTGFSSSLIDENNDFTKLRKNKVISSALYWMSSKKAAGLRRNTGMEAAGTRIGNAVLYSTTEMTVANLKAAMPGYISKLRAGVGGVGKSGELLDSDFSAANAEMGKALSRTTNKIVAENGEETFSTAVALSEYRTQEHLIHNQTVLMPNENLGSVFDWKNIDNEDLDYDKWKEAITPYLPGGKALVEKDKEKALKEAALELYKISGGDKMRDKIRGRITGDADKDAAAQEKYMQYLFGNIGRDSGLRAKGIRGIRTSIINSINAVLKQDRLDDPMKKDISDLLIHGVASPAFGNPVSAEVFKGGVYGGQPNVRPQQQYKALELDPSEIEGAERQYQVVDSDFGREFADPKFQRNAGVAFVIGARDAETGEEYGTDLAMRHIGAYEQQTIATAEASKLFGENINLHLQKVMNDLTKGEIQQLGENEPGLADPTVHFISGVPLSKLTGKHEQILTLLRGQLNNLMARAGDDATGIATRLNQIMGSDFKFTAHDGYVTSTGAQNARIRLFGEDESHILGQNSIVDRGKLKELMELSERVDAVRKKRGDDPYTMTGMFRENVFTNSFTGKKIIVNYANMILPTRILAQSSSNTRLKPDKALRNGNRPFPGHPNSGTLKITSNDIKFLVAEGYSPYAEHLLTSYAANPKTQKNLRTLDQYMQAYKANISGNPAPEKYKLLEKEDIDRRLAERTGPLTKSEYDSRYGRGMQAYDLTYEMESGEIAKKRLFIPDGIPNVEDDRSGGIRIPKAQAAFDRVLKARDRWKELGGNGETTEDEKFDLHAANLRHEIQNYQKVIGEELEGKGGLFSQSLKSMELSGKNEGFVKSLLMQARFVNNEVLEPHSAMVSEEFAQKIGASLIKGKDGRDYFYGMTLRAPNVVLGRMDTKVYVDKGMKGMGLAVHDSLREALYGDSDGDQIGMFLLGMLKGAKVSKDYGQGLIEYAEERHQEKIRDYRELEAAKAKEAFTPIRNSEEFNRVLGDKIKAYSSESTVEGQHAVAQTMGLIDSITTPIQSYLKTRIIQSETDEERDFYRRAHDGFGMAREEFLKAAKTGVSTKDGEKGGEVEPESLDAHTFVKLARNPTPVSNLVKQELPEGTGHEFENYFRDFFLAGAKADMDKGKGIFKHRAYEAAVDFISQSEKPGWFQSISKDVTSPIDRAISETGTSDGILAAIEHMQKIQSGRFVATNSSVDFVASFFNRAANVGRQVWATASDFISRAAGEVPVVPPSAYANAVPDQEISVNRGARIEPPVGINPDLPDKDLAAWRAHDLEMPPIPESTPIPEPEPIPEPVQVAESGPGPTAAGAGNPEPKSITEDMIERPSVAGALPLVEDDVKIAGRMIHEGEALSRAHSPWLVAGGIAAAGIGLGLAGMNMGGSNFQAGGGDSFTPQLPPPAPSMGGKTRVMSNEPGQTGMSYNINVRARTIKGGMTPEDFGGSVGAGLGTDVNVAMRDGRSRVKSQEDQLKGR